MKKLLLLSLILLYSCKKEYICECKNPDQNIRYYEQKGQAKTWCERNNDIWQETGGTCSLH